MDYNRRLFFKKITLFSILTLNILSLFTSCGRSDGTSDSDVVAVVTGGNCAVNGTRTYLSSNHGHPVPAISNGDVNAGVQKTYPVAVGTAGHVHTITVDATNFTTLQSNTGVIIVTDPDATGHTHSITINCA